MCKLMSLCHVIATAKKPMYSYLDFLESLLKVARLRMPAGVVLLHPCLHGWW